MKYSLVELAPVGSSKSRTEAVHNSLAAAQEAEELGYHRIWYAEHHATAGFAAQDPVSLIALAAQRTEKIRVGSGAVLLNHYSPFSVAERFMQLQAFAPTRIDLGLGRATAGPLVDAALQRDRSSQPVDDFAQQVQEILAYYHHAFDPSHPLASIDITTGIDGSPSVWILGSSGNSSRLAGELGLGYVFAGFINPALAGAALKAHEENFRVTPFGPKNREAILALNLVGAESDELAHRLTWPARLLWQRISTQGTGVTTPTLAEAEAQLPADAQDQPSTYDGDVIPTQISGNVSSLRAQLTQLVQNTGATEIMVQDMLVDEELRSKSRAIIAEAISGIATP